MEYIIQSCLVSIILLVWFKTEAWYEYTKFLDLGFLSKSDEYEKEKYNDFTITYIQFLRKNYHDNFLIRLITCPICFSLWVSLIISILTFSLFGFPFIMITGLSIYGLLCRLLDI